MTVDGTRNNGTTEGQKIAGRIMDNGVKHAPELRLGRQRMEPFSWLITILLLISASLELGFGFGVFAILQAVGFLISLTMLWCIRQGHISTHAVIAVYMVFAGSMFMYEFQFDSMNSNLTFYALISFLLFHVLGLRLGLLYCIAILLFALALCGLAWGGVVVVAHSAAELVDFFVVLVFAVGCAYFIERERRQHLMLAEHESDQLQVIGRQLNEQLDYLSSLQQLDAALLQPSYESALTGALSVLLKRLDCSRAWLLHVRPDGGVWHVPYEQALDAYPGALKAADFVPVDDQINSLFELVSTSDQPVAWDHMHDVPGDQAWLERYNIRAQMMDAVHVAGPGRWYIGVHQCDRERQWLQADKQFLNDCSHRMQAVLSQKLLNDELTLTASRANQSSDAKSGFLATMSHELRTPLHGIIGMLNLLSKGAVYLQPEHRQLLDLAQHSSHVLSSLIDDVLDLSKIEAGKISLEITEFDLSKCLQDALFPFLLAAHEKQLNLRLICQSVPICIAGDEKRLRQVLLNLLGNAVKFTDQGSVELRASYKNGHLYIEVKDSGIGIAEDQIDSLFEPFVQLSDAAERKGTGLGTTIASQFVSLMYGHIDVSSKLGCGTTFTVELPLSARDNRLTTVRMEMLDLLRCLAPESVNQDILEFLPRRILLAEDDPIARRIAWESLQQHGLKVDVAEHGLEAWEKFQQQDYDLLLTDIRMPGLDGVELTRRIRQYEKDSGAARTRIIGLSAHVLEEVAQECLASGMDDFISKPINPDVLMARLQQMH